MWLCFLNQDSEEGGDGGLSYPDEFKLKKKTVMGTIRERPLTTGGGNENLGKIDLASDPLP